jgi:hypothetical protein
MANPITRYAQIAVEQTPFNNFPGGGITTQGVAPYAQLNDAGIELGGVKEVTAIYTMLGNEVANDTVNLYLVQPNEMVTPMGTISGSGIATTATVQVGDDDITGFGLVSRTVLPLGADPARYANNLNVATGQTNPVQFAGGNSLVDPYQIGTLAVEPQGASPGASIAGAWVQLKFQTLATVISGKVLVVRLKVVKP